MSSNRSQLQILNRFFTRNSLNSLIFSNEYHLFDVCVDRLITKDLQNFTNRQVIEQLYDINSVEYRNEYFYKNTILNELLLKRHPSNKAVALNEIPIKKAKADFIIINGHATLYEIKSDIDKLDRLPHQIDQYFMGIDTVNVVTYEQQVENIIDLINNDHVGILVLKGNAISEYRKAIPDQSRLSTEVIFKLLRKHEVENILLREFGFLPEVPVTQYYRESMKCAKQIEITEFYNLAISELRKRVYINEILYNKIVPYEIRFPFYFQELRETEYEKIGEFLAKPYGG